MEVGKNVRITTRFEQRMFRVKEQFKQQLVDLFWSGASYLLFFSPFAAKPRGTGPGLSKKSQ